MVDVFDYYAYYFSLKSTSACLLSKYQLFFEIFECQQKSLCLFLEDSSPPFAHFSYLCFKIFSNDLIYVYMYLTHGTSLLYESMTFSLNFFIRFGLEQIFGFKLFL
jgi:hypothetical protein